MKLILSKTPFLKVWQMAERTTSSRVQQPSLYSVHCVASKNGTLTLEATDLKTSIRGLVEKADVVEPGRALLPVRILGDLFRKIPLDSFELEINEDRGVLRAGRNSYNFTVFPVDLFPDMPVPQAEQSFVSITAGELLRVLDEGTVAGSLTDEFPRYIGACQLQYKQDEFRAVSTDGRRLSLSKCSVLSGEEKDMLVPLAPMREFQRFLTSVEADVAVGIYQDHSLVHFRLPGMEYSVRRIESNFPNYERVLRPECTTTLTVDRSELISALERVDLVVKDNHRLVVMHLSPAGELKLTGRTPDIGEVKEHLDSAITGEPLKVAFNVSYLLDGLKAFHGTDVYLTFNGTEGQMTMLRPGSDTFLYMLMPVKMPQSEPEE